jgi:hypothetical protein
VVGFEKEMGCIDNVGRSWKGGTPPRREVSSTGTVDIKPPLALFNGKVRLVETGRRNGFTTHCQPSLLQ